VSKKLAGIGFVSVELEIRRKTAAERTKTPQQLIATGLTRNAEVPSVSDMNFHLVAFPEFKRLDHSGRKPDRKTVSPFSDLHAGSSVGYTHNQMYIYADRRQDGSLKFR
jgi:hypothetical protein